MITIIISLIIIVISVFNIVGIKIIEPSSVNSNVALSGWIVSFFLSVYVFVYQLQSYLEREGNRYDKC